MARTARQKAAARKNLAKARAAKRTRDGVTAAPGIPRWHKSLRLAGSGISGAKLKAMQKMVRYK